MSINLKQQRIKQVSFLFCSCLVKPFSSDHGFEPWNHPDAQVNLKLKQDEHRESVAELKKDIWSLEKIRREKRVAHEQYMR